MNIQEIRELFPVVKKWVYMNHIIGSPLCLKVVEEMKEAIEDMELNGVLHYSNWIKKVEELRENAALLLNADKEHIAIINNYIQGLSIVSNGYDWKEEDTVILSNVEYESLVYNWLNLASKGVVVKFVSSKEDKIAIEDIMKAVDKNTRMVILSHVQFVNGYRMSFEELSRFCKDKDILLIAECTHSLGGLEFDIKKEGVDIVIASGNKWLMGPEGCGIMYLSSRAMEKLPATTIGWRSADFGEDSSSYPIKFYESARKYEPSGISIAGVYGLNAAIKLILEIGIKNIENRVLDLSEYLTKRLLEKKYSIYSDVNPEKMSGIVSFYSKLMNAKEIRNKLLRHNVAIAEKRNYAIASLHFYNTEEEIDKMVSLLE
jgi:selenocysteine lyase/cysteine desulfurase